MGIRKGTVFLYVLSIAFLLSSSAQVSGQSSGILLIQPESSAVLPPGKTMFIGRVCGETKGEATISFDGGKKVRAGLSDGVFFKELALTNGKNRVRIEYPGAKPLVIEFLVQSNGKYKYHITDLQCKDCHKKAFSVMRPEDSLCYRCHDKKDEKKFVHGPLGGGACTICHEPHGSRSSYYLREDTTVLCTSCHDQSSSKTHIEKAKNRKCDKCHNPHSSDKEYFLR